MMAFLEIFVHQAAMILERMRLSAEVQRGREERAALSQALVQAQEAEQFKNQLLRAASDGLRTPLTVIQGYLELLRDDHLIENDAQKTRLLTKASLACEELILRLGNVVDANYIDRNQEMLSLGSVNVQRSVQSILDIFGPIIARDKRTVTARVAENICVQADSLRLSQILFTIMSNALEHTPIASKIAIDVECVSDEMLYQRAWFVEQQLARPVAEFFVVLAIRDWGKGIKKEDQQRLFTMGTYSSAALEGTQQKAGVGLYLSRQLLEAMGGYIWVESSGIPGEGAQFLIALPRSDEKK
jgi:signal transduction histidine kinase